MNYMQYGTYCHRTNPVTLDILKLRWKGKLAALYLRHEKLANEMVSRNYHHKSELDRKYATGYSSQNQFVNTYDEQIKILKNKGCKCNLGDY